MKRISFFVLIILMITNLHSQTIKIIREQLSEECTIGKISINEKVVCAFIENLIKKN